MKNIGFGLLIIFGVILFALSSMVVIGAIVFPDPWSDPWGLIVFLPFIIMGAWAIALGKEGLSKKND